jgi:transcriptional regulator with XRE-family HTH domain
MENDQDQTDESSEVDGSTKETHLDAQLKAWDLRLKGYSYSEIAKELEIDPKKATKYLQRAYRIHSSQLEETMERNRHFDLMRLDYAIKKIFKVLEAEGTDDEDMLKAIALLIDTIRTRGALLGYDKKNQSAEAAEDLIRFLSAQRERIAYAARLKDPEEAARLREHSLDIDSDASIMDSEMQ